MRMGTAERAISNPPLEGGSKNRKAIFRGGVCRSIEPVPLSQNSYETTSAGSIASSDATYPSPEFAAQISTLPRGEGRAFKLIFAAILAGSTVVTASYAGWRDEAAPRDVERLSHLTEARQKGLDEAAAGKPSDVEAIRSILQAGTVSAGGRVTGAWRCRTMKLGGLTPTIVYSWFRCRISDRGGRLFFEKIGGSQRMSGYLYPEGEGYVYLGASYVHYNGANEKPTVYSGNGASAGAGTTPDDQIGMLSLTYDGRARLELPYPVQESTFDVIELKK